MQMTFPQRLILIPESDQLVLSVPPADINAEGHWHCRKNTGNGSSLPHSVVPKA